MYTTRQTRYRPSCRRTTMQLQRSFKNFVRRQAARPPGSRVIDENGSALITAMIVLVVLTLLGVIATRTTETEIKIAANDKWHKVVFYAADGATELASELLEQNLETLNFDDPVIGGLVEMETPDFWTNEYALATTPNDLNRDFFLPAGYAAGDPHTNFTAGGYVKLAEGAAIPMAAGYEGLGKGAAHGGAQNIYDIITQRVGANNSESIVRIKWRHVD